MNCTEAHADSEQRDRLLLLLVAQPKVGFEREFEELLKKEIERFMLPPNKGERDA